MSERDKNPSNVVPFPSRQAAPKVGDPVICNRDGKPGFVERLFVDEAQTPCLAVVRVQGGFGARLLGFGQFAASPRAGGA